MNLDPSEVVRLAKQIDEENGESLAELFLELLELEHSARHKKRVNLQKGYREIIDAETEVSDG